MSNRHCVFCGEALRFDESNATCDKCYRLSGMHSGRLSMNDDERHEVETWLRKVHTRPLTSMEREIEAIERGRAI